MEQENKNNIISSIINIFNLENCFNKNKESIYNTKVDLKNNQTNLTYDTHRLARRRTQFMI